MLDLYFKVYSKGIQGIFNKRTQGGTLRDMFKLQIKQFHEWIIVWSEEEHEEERRAKLPIGAIQTPSPRPLAIRPSAKGSPNIESHPTGIHGDGVKGCGDPPLLGAT